MAPDAAANPYAPPSGDIEFVRPPGEGAFPRALFGPRQILACTLYGSLPLGLFLMWWNYRAMGKTSLALRTIVLGLPVSALWVALLLLMPARIEPAFVKLFTSLQFYGFCNPIQGPAVYHHLAAGGPRISHALVVGIIGLHMLLVGVVASAVDVAAR